MTEERKRCFVLMGFGQKVDYKTKRTLDLDKTYKIIRAAVDKAGLECIRADDIVHSGVIDKPMYENLLMADVAIADLSTSNENAIYELGVRHALKPRTTIIIAEKEFKFPFDLGHVVIRPVRASWLRHRLRGGRAAQGRAREGDHHDREQGGCR